MPRHLLAPRFARAHAAMAFALSFVTVMLLPAIALAAEEDLFARSIKKGPIMGALAALAGGLLVSLTPCVYPMIAITVSVFGAREAKSRAQAMMLSTSFVLGIVALFTPMLVIAAFTGGLFGAILASKVVVVGICVVFIAMAASMFGAFDLTLPESVMQRFSTVGGIGYGGAFLLGLVSGLVAAPCTGPVLTSILVWISQTRSVPLAIIVGACFSIGLGMPFWLVGTFAISLPKGGKWMLGVKSFFGIVMLIVALYFLKNAFPVLKSFVRPDARFMLISFGVLVAGIALGAVHLAWDDGGKGVIVRKSVGIAMAVIGGAALWTSFDLPRGSLNWLHSEPEATTLATSEKRPMIIDFTAEWCGACKEIAKETFSDPRVQQKALLANFVTVKVDATDVEDVQIDAVKGKYKVVGLPTVVIYDSTGKERKRFNEFVGPEPFLAALEGID